MARCLPPRRRHQLPQSDRRWLSETRGIQPDTRRAYWRRLVAAASGGGMRPANSGKPAPAASRLPGGRGLYLEVARLRGTPCWCAGALVLPPVGNRVSAASARAEPAGVASNQPRAASKIARGIGKIDLLRCRQLAACNPGDDEGAANRRRSAQGGNGEVDFYRRLAAALPDDDIHRAEP